MRKLTLILVLNDFKAVSEINDTKPTSRKVTLELKPGLNETLSQSIYLSGVIEPRPLCSGLGRCGLCRVRFTQNPPPPLPGEIKVLKEHELLEGWRLSCLRNTASCFDDTELNLELPAQAKLIQTASRLGLPLQNSEQNAERTSAIAQDRKNFGLALDVGTTSVHWSLVRKPSPQPTNLSDSTAAPHTPAPSAHVGKTAGIFINPQMGAGSDVISRLGAAADTTERARLQQLTIQALQRALKNSPGEIPLNEKSLGEICLAANSAMTLILLNKDVSGLLAAPYHLDYRGGRTEQVPGLPDIWVAPLLAPFVGGDISAGVAALSFAADYDGSFNKPEYPFMLADLGTNGEFALCLSPSEAIVGSVPMGPALEGIGLSCGSMIGVDAEAKFEVISGFKLTPLGLEGQMPVQTGNTNHTQTPVQASTPGNTTGNAAGNSSAVSPPPSRISATAYLAMLNHLVKLGIITNEGLFDADSRQVLAKRILLTSHSEGRQSRLITMPTGGKRLLLSPGRTEPYLSSEDVEEILKVKAAFSVAVQELLKTAGLTFSNLKRFYLAGSLGKHVQTSDLEGLGFLPPGGALSASAVGNSSLAGAELFLKAPASRDQILKWTEGVRHLELTATDNFTGLYMDHMRFSFYTSAQ